MRLESAAAGLKMAGFKKGHKPWNKGKKINTPTKRQPASKEQKKRKKQAKKRKLLSIQKRQERALKLLYGSVDMAERVRGRKSLFREYMYKEGQKLALLGRTNAQIAEFWNISLRTLQRWMVSKPDFCHMIKRAKAEADLQVEGGLLKRAKGYTYIEQTRELRPAAVIEGQPAGVPIMTVVKEVTKHVVPDVGGCALWLLNRQPDRWKDKRQLEIPPGARLPLEIIISNGDESKRLTTGDGDKKDNLALPAPRESTSKH